MEFPNFKELNKFKNKNILVIGDLILDEYVVGHKYRISDEAPVPILAVDSFEVRLGGAANVAKNLKELSCQVLLCGVMGLGYSSTRFNRLLESSNIDTSLVIAGHGIFTTTKTRIIINNQQVARYDYEKTDLQDSTLSDIQDRIKSVEYDKVDAIIVSDYNKGVISKRVMDFLKSTDRPIIVDPKPCNQALYSDVFCITPNKKEFCQMIGMNENDAVGIRLKEACKEFLKQNTIDHLVVTVGEDGALVCNKDVCEFISGPKKQIVNIIGAGDTFVSALSISLISGMDIFNAARIANIASGIVISKKYTSTCSLEELYAMVSKNGINEI